MFKIENTTIHCSRGDVGTITLKIPITDKNNYVRYEDETGTCYWYDTQSKKLYDENYNISDVALNTLRKIFYEFQENDKVSFKIYNKNGYDKEPLMTKDVIVAEKSDSVDIPLLQENTTFGNSVNKATIFWYDITLNDNLTVVCFDEDGAKEFIEYPAKGDGE